MKSSNALTKTHLVETDIGTDTSGPLSNVVEIHQAAISQSAINMRVAVHSISLLERQACLWLKFYHGRFAAMAETLSSYPGGSVENSVSVNVRRVLTSVTESSEEAGKVWAAAYELTSDLLSGVSEQMSTACHSLSLTSEALAPQQILRPSPPITARRNPFAFVPTSATPLYGTPMSDVEGGNLARARQQAE